MSNTLSNIRTLFGRKTVISAALVAGALGSTVAMVAPASASTANWNAIAQRESSGNWHTNTGNGYGGGLQISPTTSAALGGPSSAAGIAALSQGQQIALAEKILAAQGPGAWPNTYVGGGSGSTGHSTSGAPTHSTSGAPTRSTSGASTYHPTTTHRSTYAPTYVRHTATVKTHTFSSGHAVSHTTSGRPLFTTALAGTYRADVAAWQAKLAGFGYNIAVDGHYGQQSAKVAHSFQTAHHLLVDGIVGPQTWGATFG